MPKLVYLLRCKLRDMDRQRERRVGKKVFIATLCTGFKVEQHSVCAYQAEIGIEIHSPCWVMPSIHSMHKSGGLGTRHECKREQITLSALVIIQEVCFCLNIGI